MACKKCDCEMRLYIQNLEHDREMEELENKFIRLRRDMAYFMYSLTGDIKHMHGCEFELKNGGW
jgi:hypothetical protein